MLKVTVLTCAIISLPPFQDAARAADAVRILTGDANPMVWTGRFVTMNRTPAPMRTPDNKVPDPADDRGDPDVVGSIPLLPSQEFHLPPPPRAGLSNCPLFDPALGPAGQDLACNGVENSRWSAKIEHFNYDLSNAKLDVLYGLLPSPESGNEKANVTR